MKKNIIKILVVITLLMIAIAILKKAPNYIRDEIKNKVNLVINNSNVTTSLKNDIYIDENDVIYLSKEDIDNFFDEYIYYDKKYNQIITTSENKIATLEVANTTIYINGEEQTIKSPVIEKNGRYFLPISELQEVYNISVEYVEKTDRVVIESLNREQKKTECIKDNSIKYKTTIFSKTVDKVKKGESVVVVSEMDNWLKVRTDNGILGYMKKNDAKDVTVSRTEKKKEKQIDGKVSLVWDYFSEYGSAPDRAGTRINGINVVSPTFFTLTDEGKGKIDVNVGNEGLEYIQWAHSNGYKVWPSISNNSYIQTTSDIMNDYKLRQRLIENIVNLIKKYNLDGINIDFEYMFVDDKELFSRFIIELAPRLNEIGATLSVDVTAPDGSPNWSLCYNRHVIGKIADYIVFMAYDQHGGSSEKIGTNSGYDWIETNINKFIGTQEEIDAEKVILALPFYTRVWKKKNGELDNIAVAMKDIQDVIPSNASIEWDDELKQYYIEYDQNGATYKLWSEDEKSLEAKLSLIDKYNLAGAAYWQKDMETSNIWKIISEKLGIN